MTTEPQLVEELRILFRKGATPSRLIRRLAENYTGDRPWSFFVSDYFWAAFQVPIRVPESSRPPATNEMNFESLNRHEIHEILERRAVWDDESLSAGAWYRSLIATDDLTQLENIRPEQHPELTASWTGLDSKARDYLRMRLANAVGYYERMLILSALTEQLQRRIEELETQVGRDRDAFDSLKETAQV